MIRRRNRQHLAQLARATFFSACSRKELAAIVSLCTPIDVEAGRVLTHMTLLVMSGSEFGALRALGIGDSA
jgi:hypothetical protein